MSALNKPAYPHRQRGIAAVELAIISIAFFTAVFGVIEIGRSMYIVNTLQEVTRRAASEASNTKLGDAPSLAKVSQHAVFRDDEGPLAFAEPITDQNVRIDYMALIRQSDGTMKLQAIDPSAVYCAAKNKWTCLGNPNAANCVRFVRARICDSSSTTSCNPVEYQTLFSLVKFPLYLPVSATIVVADTLGFVPGTTPCS